MLRKKEVPWSFSCLFKMEQCSLTCKASMICKSKSELALWRTVNESMIFDELWKCEQLLSGQGFLGFECSLVNTLVPGIANRCKRYLGLSCILIYKRALTWEQYENDPLKRKSFELLLTKIRCSYQCCDFWIDINIVFSSSKVWNFFSWKDHSHTVLRSEPVYKFECLGDRSTSWVAIGHEKSWRFEIYTAIRKKTKKCSP